MHVVWFIPDGLVGQANAILDQLGRGPRNFRRKAEDAGGNVWWFTADEPGQEFLDTWAAAEAGDMGPDVQGVVEAARVFVSPDMTLPEEEQVSLSALDHITQSLEAMGLEALPEGA